MIWYRKFSLKTFLLLGDKIWVWREMLRHFINRIISGIISGSSRVLLKAEQTSTQILHRKRKTLLISTSRTKSYSAMALKRLKIKDLKQTASETNLFWDCPESAATKTGCRLVSWRTRFSALVEGDYQRCSSSPCTPATGDSFTCNTEFCNILPFLCFLKVVGDCLSI